MGHCRAMKAEEKTIYFNALGLKPSKGDLRRIALVEAAISCMATMGLEKTTYDAIGKKLGVRRSHVAYYYKDLNDLVKDAVRYIIATGAQITDSHLHKAGPGIKQIEGIVNGSFSWFKKHPDHVAVMLGLYYLAARDPQYKKLNTELRLGGTTRISEALKVIAPKKNSSWRQVTADAINSMIAGTLIELATTQSKVILEKRSKDLLKSIAVLVSH